MAPQDISSFEARLLPLCSPLRRIPAVLTWFAARLELANLSEEEWTKEPSSHRISSAILTVLCIIGIKPSTSSS
jgi:hypothetical protein